MVILTCHSWVILHIHSSEASTGINDNLLFIFIVSTGEFAIFLLLCDERFSNENDAVIPMGLSLVIIGLEPSAFSGIQGWYVLKHRSVF